MSHKKCEGWVVVITHRGTRQVREAWHELDARSMAETAHAFHPEVGVCYYLAGVPGTKVVVAQESR